MRLGIIDTGIGGITTTSHIFNTNLFEEIIYYSDRLNAPYGDKSVSDINALTSNLLYKLNKYNLDYIFIACHTISVNLADDIKKNSKVPLISISDAITYKINKNIGRNKKILFIGTTATINSNYYQNFLNYNEYTNVEFVKTPELAQMVEDMTNSDTIVSYLTTKLSEYKDYEYVVIGCTHYNFVADDIKKVLPNAKLIFVDDSVEDFLFHSYKLHKKYETKIKFFDTKDNKYIKKLGKEYLGLENEQ